jgi:hypothetical protein
MEQISIVQATLDDTNLNLDCRSLQNVLSTNTTFSILPQCGDSSISYFMSSGHLPTIVSISPNPTSSTTDVSFYSPNENCCRLEVYDEIGNFEYVQAVESSPRIQHIHLDFEKNGVHNVRLVSGRQVCSRRVIVRK